MKSSGSGAGKGGKRDGTGLGHRVPKQVFPGRHGGRRGKRR